jgi:hypothetical protein
MFYLQFKKTTVIGQAKDPTSGSVDGAKGKKHTPLADALRGRHGAGSTGL